MGSERMAYKHQMPKTNLKHSMPHKKPRKIRNPKPVPRVFAPTGRPRVKPTRSQRMALRDTIAGSTRKIPTSKGGARAARRNIPGLKMARSGNLVPIQARAGKAGGSRRILTEGQQRSALYWGEKAKKEQESKARLKAAAKIKAEEARQRAEEDARLDKARKAREKDREDREREEREWQRKYRGF
jgi:hypothetical protein